MRSAPANVEIVTLQMDNGRRVRIADGRHLQFVGGAKPKREPKREPKLELKRDAADTRGNVQRPWRAKLAALAARH